MDINIVASSGFKGSSPGPGAMLGYCTLIRLRAYDLGGLRSENGARFSFRNFRLHCDVFFFLSQFYCGDP